MMSMEVSPSSLLIHTMQIGIDDVMCACVVMVMMMMMMMCSDDGF